MDSATFQTLADELADRYRLETVIGRGAMATVVRAKDQRHGRTVAIKILDPEFGAALGAERFLAEIRVTAGLQHPHLLPLFDSGIAAGFLYYVMPFIDGASLRQRLERERQLPLDDVVRITGMLAGALEHAHAHGVLHRDLKPDNILLQGDQPLLADFGIALVSGDAGRPRITQTGFSVGTPQYMSPEQASADRDLSPRSDQFALAAVAYEMLAGEPPHTGPTPQSILARRLTERPRPVHVTRPGLPEAVSAVLERALSPTPADRYPSASAFADALAVAARGPGGAATVTGPMRGTGEVAPNGGDRRRWLAATIVIGAVLAVGAWWALTRRAGAASVLPFDTVLTVPVGVSADDALTARLDDAVAQQLGILPMRRVKTYQGTAEPSDDEAMAAARSVGAAWVVRASLVRGTGTAQLRLRLLDAERNALVRQLPGTSVPLNADAGTIDRAVEPLAVAAGFVTSRTLGMPTLPLDPLPRLDAFIAFENALDGIRVGTLQLGAPALDAALRRVAALDTTFLQVRLWLGTTIGWGGVLGRTSGGAALTDSILAWAAEAEVRGVRHEQTLAQIVRSQIAEFQSRDLDAIRREVVAVPRSPLNRLLVSRLLEANRPYEALRVLQAQDASGAAADSASQPMRAGIAAQSAEVWHYVGQYDSALTLIRRAQSLRGSVDVGYLGTELSALAALGRLDELRRRLPEIETAPADGTFLGFAGNVYTTVSAELSAHGHRDEARRVAALGVEWFRFRSDVVRDRASFGVRMAVLLQLLGRDAEAERVVRSIKAGVSDNEVRAAGFLGRLGAMQGRQPLVDSVTALLEALPATRLQGAPTYELATITANKGRAHWDEAVRLLEMAFRQNVGFTIRRRLHAFSDWTPLRDYPPFRQLITPADSLQRN